MHVSLSYVPVFSRPKCSRGCLWKLVALDAVDGACFLCALSAMTFNADRLNVLLFVENCVGGISFSYFVKKLLRSTNGFMQSQFNMCRCGSLCSLCVSLSTPEPLFIWTGPCAILAPDTHCPMMWLDIEKFEYATSFIHFHVTQKTC